LIQILDQIYQFSLAKFYSYLKLEYSIINNGILVKKNCKREEGESTKSLRQCRYTNHVFESIGRGA
jgi:hypothetical protein